MILPVIQLCWFLFLPATWVINLLSQEQKLHHLLRLPPPPVAETDSDTPFEVVDEMPVFKGGDTALIDYIKNNTKYPEPAKVKGIQGKVIVRFAVEADGSIDKISVLKGVDPELDKEALRVVGTLPTFEKPGIKDGKAVSVWYYASDKLCFEIVSD